MEIVLATANPDKGAEIERILRTAGVAGIELVPRPAEAPDVDETGTTLEENARLKAVALCEFTGLAAVADDTGLEVDALDGAPGVYTARYSGPNATYASNVSKLVADMRGVSAGQRNAHFRTIALLRFPDGRELVAEGAVDGVIVEEPRGENGFGYDPVFQPAEGDGRTFAEMTGDEKNALSHRGRAFRALATLMVEAGLV